MHTKARWLLGGLVVVLTVAAALWPILIAHRLGDSRVDSGLPAAPGSVATTSATGRSALVPCPHPKQGSASVGDLAGVSAPCLIDAKDIDLGAALAGTAALVNLWASWCAPCREEMPVLNAYASQPGAIPVVGVDVEDRSDAAIALMSDLGIRYPSFGPADAVAQALDAPPVLPLTYLVSPDGVARRVTSTPVFHDPAQVREAVAGMAR
ncbi:TlpA family protein disulfide reductase [Skermania sp. ID1734]|uniref:TlpA family protein disulfide reductase n=1 Tax=Skermania sp. ID1734 TaxID=2597516 RepID=UPI00117D4A1D|nr:TlpA disulfide reductase family protein [Skermania sp. ID1734]TSD93802.1 TlpA family protein disulfide reductase [Skermania sp. ID1734]